jgi:hypothetical protein
MAAKKAVVGATSRLQGTRSRTARNLPQPNMAQSKAPHSKDGGTAEGSSVPSSPAARLSYQRHGQSIEKAKAAFKNFNLHKFSLDAVPKNYVHPDKVKDPAAVLAVHKALIQRQLAELPQTDAYNSGIGITAPVAKWKELQQALSGLGEHGGKVGFEHLLAYLRGRMNSSAFQSRGNPVLTRLTADMAARRQARAIIERIKKRSSAPESNAKSGAETDRGLAARTQNPPSPLVHRKKGSESHGQ